MASETQLPGQAFPGIEAGRLFTGARFAVGTGAARFVAITAIMA